jgi:hypothetical protein
LGFSRQKARALIELCSAVGLWIVHLSQDDAARVGQARAAITNGRIVKEEFQIAEWHRGSLPCVP